MSSKDFILKACPTGSSFSDPEKTFIADLLRERSCIHDDLDAGGRVKLAIFFEIAARPFWFCACMLYTLQMYDLTYKHVNLVKVEVQPSRAFAFFFQT